MGKSFQELYSHDVSAYVAGLEKEYKDKETGEKKSYSLSYIPWADALRVMYELDPDAEYTIREWDGKPYLDTGRGGLVNVKVKLFGKVRESYLPIMDAKYDPIIEFDAFDVNTAIQRCIVKALAHHGVGLSLYKKDNGGRAGSSASKYPPMKAPINGAPFNLAVTFLGAREFDKNWKVDCVTENGEGVKLTVWKRKFTSIPATGETVLIAGVWELHERYGDSVTVEKIASLDEVAGKTGSSAGAGQGEGETKKIADSPANRAAVLKKYKALAEQADALGVKYETPEQLRDRGANVDDLTEAGVKLSAAIEKAKRDAADTGSQAPTKPKSQAAAGWPA